MLPHSWADTALYAHTSLPPGELETNKGTVFLLFVSAVNRYICEH